MDDLIRKAETGEDWAEICRLEAENVGAPFYCKTCGVEINTDESPCDLEYGEKCGANEGFEPGEPEFCMVHGYEHMKADRGPIAYCVECERLRYLDQGPTE